MGHMAVHFRCVPTIGWQKRHKYNRTYVRGKNVVGEGYGLVFAFPFSLVVVRGGFEGRKK